MILLIDNYDSFTHNLAHLIGGLGHSVEVVRNDAMSATDAVNRSDSAIVLSPGPCTPDDAGICLDLVRFAAEIEKPVFGVCLGMQAIAQAFGGKIERAGQLMHGKTSEITHEGSALFTDIPSPFTATRYHSLVAKAETLPNELHVSARSLGEGEIMAVEHAYLPIAGVQFHPESIASEHGAQILANFLRHAQ